MPDNIRIASADEARELVRLFAEAAAPHILSATPVNRFLITPGVLRADPILVVGTAVFIEALPDIPKRPIISVASSLSFSKNVAEDLIVRLEHIFGITEEDRQAALARNATAQIPPKS